MTTTYTIPQKMSGTGTIHDIASDQFDRDIVFAPGDQYAVVNASYYGGKGYTTHQTAEEADAASRRNCHYSHRIIDVKGNEYDSYGEGDDSRLVRRQQPANDSECSECGAKVASIIGCPDGAELCQDCFDAGQH